MGVKYNQFLFLTNCEGLSKYKMLQALDIELKGASEVKISAIWQLRAHTHTHSKVKSLQSQKPPERKWEGDLSNLTRLWEMVSWRGFGGWVNGFCEDTYKSHHVWSFANVYHS